MKQTILSYAEGLSLDESRTGLTCPTCKGGVSRDKSFVVTRVADGVLWYCYRAKCGEKGKLLSIDRALMRGERKRKKVFVPKIYDEPTIELTKQQKEWFYGRNDIPDSVLVSSGVRYNPVRNSFVFPIRDYRGYEIGVEDRVYDGTRSLKSIHYWSHDAERVHCCRLMVKPQEKIVVVEDMLSGLKCNQFAPTIVALGTALNQKIEYIRRFTSNVVLYLDKDAMSKAIGYKKKYSMFFDSFKVVYTRADPKDTSNEKLKELLDCKPET